MHLPQAWFFIHVDAEAAVDGKATCECEFWSCSNPKLTEFRKTLFDWYCSGITRRSLSLLSGPPEPLVHGAATCASANSAKDLEVVNILLASAFHTAVAYSVHVADALDVHSE